MQCSIRTVIVLSFLMQRDYISKNLCENRDKPQLHCNGSCCLKKELKKQEKNEQQLPALVKGETDVYFFREAAPALFTLSGKPVLHHSPYLLKLFPAFPDAVFRPPSFSCLT